MQDELKERAYQFLGTWQLDAGLRGIPSPLAKGLSALLASERAAALGAAAGSLLRRLESLRKHFGEDDSRVEAAREFELTSAAKYILEDLTPTGWRGIREGDLAVLVEAAEEALAHYYAPLEELASYKDRADEIRAALKELTS